MNALNAMINLLNPTPRGLMKARNLRFRLEARREAKAYADECKFWQDYTRACSEQNRQTAIELERLGVL